MAAWLALLPLVEQVLDKVLPDKEAKAKAMLELQSQQQDFELKVAELGLQASAQQTEINKIEAASEDRFASRWRPLIGYVCAFAFAYKFVLQPFLIFFLVAIGSSFDYHRLPVLDWAEMSPVLLGLLGLGGMRTMEKIKK